MSKLYNDRHVLDRLGHRRQSTFDRLSDTYSPSTTKSRPDRANSKDHSRGKSRPYGWGSPSRDRPRSRGCSRGVEESYNHTSSSYRTGTKHGYRSRDRNRSRYVKRGRESESPLSRVSESGTSDVEHWKSKGSRGSRAARVWFDELPPESINGYKDLKAAFLAYFMQQKKYVKDPVEIHNIKQRDGETIEEFMERFKVETGRMKGAPECMRISGFMHGVNNPKLTKRLNEHVPKTMEEMMIATIAFIRGEAAAAGKKKGHAPWRAQEQSKRQASERRSDFRGKLSHLIKEIKQGRDQTKAGRKESNQSKDKSHGNYMITTMASSDNAKVTQSFERVSEITFPSLTTSSGTEGLLVIEAEIGVHMNSPQCSSCVTYRDADHSTKAWMNFMIVRSLSPYNGIIGRPGIREIQAVPSTAHEMLKFPADEGKRQVGQNIEVYVDDLVIKSHTEAEMLRDIDETFRTLRKINMKLNPKKCTFGAVEGMFLGYMITPEGIKPCPSKTEAVLQLPSPRTIKEAFKQLKQHLSELPLLVAPKPKEELIVYLSASPGAISAVLMTERGAVQTPVYFVSRALQGPELNYTPMEKLVLSLVFAAKRLRRYFQAHPIAVITDQPIKQIMSRPDVAGRLQKWSVMLGEHNITYRPRTSVKGQILADFLVEKPDESPSDTPMVEVPQEPWTLFTDGSSCIDGSGAGLILTSPEGTEFTYALRFQFTASNNEAEYEALIAGLRIAAQMGVRNVHVSVDSKLVANQVLGTYVAKEENMVKYLEKAKSLISGFANFSISQVPRSKNKKADALSKIASTSFAHLSKQVLVEILKEKSIQEKEVATVVEEEGPTWMTPIMEYLKDGTLPGDRKDASKLRINARQYKLIEGVLYKRSFLKPWLRCVGPLQVDYVIREIHEGSCNMHTGPRSVVAKAMRLGYYWPTMHRDARDMIHTCNDCQVHRPVPRNPQQPLTLITALWPFYKWGIDIAGPFSEGAGKVKFLIVAMHYFTKWIEAKAVATITGNQTNKLVKRANRSLGEGIKARLGEGNKNWIEELPHVLWAHRTMIKSSQGDTPFSLTYGTEAVIPAKIGMPTYRTAIVDAAHNDEELLLNLDLLEERRERAAIREAKAKSKMTKHYNASVTPLDGTWAEHVFGGVT
ncbi:reverse transcriptase domain-containing protein [Tanacetum coccineum]